MTKTDEPTPLVAIIPMPLPAQAGGLPMGTSRSPTGREITVNSQSLLRDGLPWLPVMGEFHYARYPETEWRDELLKMQAGGIDIVASYQFWIHHEEQEGRWDWLGRRDLRRFARLCGEVGLTFVARIGPWCHGEVRNGGLPDWLLQVSATRTDDPRYLDHVRRFYAEIAGQLQGLLCKDGGPVIGVQIENEYGGPAEHLLTLKRLALEAGLDVPLYTRTGWPELSTPMPLGALLPLFGGYPDGFWDRSLEEMPPGYRGAFLFSAVRADAAIATDQLGVRDAVQEEENQHYPYFACEIGGGMERSYHRRIRMAPGDIAALALVKLGSGSNLQGYYMYHGGTNPEGTLSTLQESQATGYWNDLPVKSYDFQAPLGEFGQVRDHYHSLRRMHLFLRDFGASLARMPSTLPEKRPTSPDDTDTLRWSVRSDGHSGFLFVNNCQRLQPMPPKEGVRFDLRLTGGSLIVPARPVTLPADRAFFWPFNLDMGGAGLVHATAQLVCRLEDQGTDYFVFAQTPGVPSEFVFDGAGLSVETVHGEVTEAEGQTCVRLQPGTEIALLLRMAEGRHVAVLLLDEPQSLTCWKGTFAGRQCLFLTRAALLLDGGDGLRLRSADPADLTVAVFPAPPPLAIGGIQAEARPDGLFQRFTAPAAPIAPVEAVWEQIKSAGPARRIGLGGQGVAEAPSDADFEDAAVWRLHLPVGVAAGRDLRLRIHYTGDVARVLLDGVLLTDNFYNGDPFEVGLKRHAPDVYAGDLRLQILPLRPDAPIYLPRDAWPGGDADGMAALRTVEVIEEQEVELRCLSSS